MVWRGDDNTPPLVDNEFEVYGQRFTTVTIPLVAAVLPSSRSVEVKTPATALATIINAGPTQANNVGIALPTLLPLSFIYQTTDATGVIIGDPNTPVNIAPGGAQNFVLVLTPSGAFTSTDMVFNFIGSNTLPVTTILGVNTLLFSASDTAVPDVVALAATLNGDGIVNLPGASGTGVFAVATVNVGLGGPITATANTGGVSLPVTLSMCQTDPLTGCCLAGCIVPTTTSIPTTIDANATPSFGIFVQGTGTVPFDPAVNRIFVSFADTGGGAVRGSTSAAVRTTP